MEHRPSFVIFKKKNIQQTLETNKKHQKDLRDGRADERKSRSMDAHLLSGETSRQRQNCQISKSSSDRSIQNSNILFPFDTSYKS